MVDKSQLVALGIGFLFGGLNAGLLATYGLPREPPFLMGLIMETTFLFIATFVALFSPSVAGWWLIIGGFTIWALLYFGPPYYSVSYSSKTFGESNLTRPCGYSFYDLHFISIFHVFRLFNS